MTLQLFLECVSIASRNQSAKENVNVSTPGLFGFAVICWRKCEQGNFAQYLFSIMNLMSKYYSQKGHDNVVN